MVAGVRSVDGLGLTKTHALQRAVVREAAERWPHWWNHELFGPPHREAELPVLQETHAGLRRLRLHAPPTGDAARDRARAAAPRRPRGTLRAPARGSAAAKVSRATRGELIEGALQESGPLEPSIGLWTASGLLLVQGWRAADGAPLEGWALSGALQPVLWRAEGYGLLSGPRAPLMFELTAAGHRLAAGAPTSAAPRPAAGDAALVFDAELVNARGVERGSPCWSASH